MNNPTSQNCLQIEVGEHYLDEAKPPEWMQAEIKTK